MPGATEPRMGRLFEYRVRDFLRANGYFVMRSPASRSVVDMVAIKPGQVLFVQCKVNGRMDPAEWNALYRQAQTAGAVPVMASRPDRGKIAWWELTGLKWLDSGRRRQPLARFIIDEITDDGVL